MYDTHWDFIFLKYCRYISSWFDFIYRHWFQVKSLMQSCQSKEGLELHRLLSDTNIQVHKHDKTSKKKTFLLVL